MAITNLYGLPEPIYQAVVNDSYRGGGDISVTTLIKPPRIRVLERRHKDKITEDASRRLWSLLGQATHYILERGETAGHIKEHRIAKEVNGWIVTGQFDLLRLAGSKLSDYKVTSVFSFLLGDKPEWEQQLNILRWLCNGGWVWNPDKLAGVPAHGTVVNFDINELEINAILRDWRESDKEKDENYPRIPFQSVPIEVWTMDKAEAFVRGRVKIHQEAEKYGDSDLPHCSDAERWAKPDTWAVKKPGAKRALAGGVHESLASAQAFQDANKGSVIEHRKGGSPRCERFCLAQKFCNQYAEMKAKED